jgi:hypothetical protein
MAGDALQLRGDPVAAEDLARRALADGPTSLGAASTTYSTLSLCAAIAGDSDRQLEILLDGQRAVAGLGAASAHYRAFFEMQIAHTHALRGDPRAARTHATEAVRLAREAEFPFRLAQALNAWAEVERYDDPGAAEAALAEAADIAPETLPVAERGRTLLMRSQLRAQAGDVRGAVALLHQALGFWGNEVPTLYVATTSQRAAKTLAAIDEFRPAAVLAGAATTGRYASLTNLLEPRAHEELDRTIRNLRAQLGSDAYDIEAARGAAMSSEDILRFLRAAVDHLIDPPRAAPQHD